MNDNMIKKVYDDVVEMAINLKTLDDVLAAALTKDYDETYNGIIPGDAFVKFIYDEVSKQQTASDFVNIKISTQKAGCMNPAFLYIFKNSV